MPRPPRIDHPGARHHVMNRGARRQVLFHDDRACLLFLDLLDDLHVRFGVIVHGYALMPNHFHLLLQTPRGNLSRAMQHLGSAFTVGLNRLHLGWDGPVFRGRFKNRLVEDEAYWMHLLAYLHLNPVEGKLVADVDASRWTSHAAYVGAESCPRWLRTGELLDLFGGLEAYRGYLWEVQVGREKGPAEFDAKALWTASRTGRVPEGAARPKPPREERALLPTAEEALAAVARVTGEPIAALSSSARGPGGNPARWLAAWWLERAAGLSQAEIGRLLGADMAQVSRFIGRVRRPGEHERLLLWRSLLEVPSSGT